MTADLHRSSHRPRSCSFHSLHLSKALAPALRRRRSSSSSLSPSPRDGQPLIQPASDLLDSLDLPIAWGIFTSFIQHRILDLEVRLDSLSSLFSLDDPFSSEDHCSLVHAFIEQVRDYLYNLLHGFPLPDIPEVPFVLVHLSSSSDDIVDSVRNHLYHLHSLALYFRQIAPNTTPSLATLSSLYAAVPSPSGLVSAADPNSVLSDFMRTYVAEESSRFGAFVNAEKEKLKLYFQQESDRFRTFFHFESTNLKERIVDEAEDFKHALCQGAKRLLRYDELPAPWKNNQYILSGYRFIPIDRWQELVWSGVCWHNETGNIYTHLIGALSIVYLLFYVFPESAPANSPFLSDSVVLLSFIFCALKCLLLSSSWHLLSGCATYHVFNRSACLDYVGISALISATIGTVVHYGFYCRPDLSAVYGSVVTALGVLGFILPWVSWFNKREHRGWRITFFLCMCASGLCPIFHMAILYGFKETFFFYSSIILSIATYLVGLALYAFNIPERLKPGGIFDTLFHSHQFWHIAVVSAIWMHWWAVLRFYEKGTTGFSCKY